MKQKTGIFIEYLIIIILLWAAIANITQAIKCPKMTEIEIIIHTPKSFMCDWKECKNQIMKQKTKNEIIDILTNVQFWDTCPDDYKNRIDKILEDINPKAQHKKTISEILDTIDIKTLDKLYKEVANRDYEGLTLKEYLDGWELYYWYCFLSGLK